MTEFTFDENTVSDLHKDAFGFRPSQSFYQEWKAKSNEEKQKEWDYLCGKLEESIADEKARQAQAVIAFEKRVAECMKSGAKTREDALKWIVDSLDMSSCWDAGYVCYTLDIPYSMSKEFEPFVKGERNDRWL